MSWPIADVVDWTSTRPTGPIDDDEFHEPAGNPTGTAYEGNGFHPYGCADALTVVAQKKQERGTSES